jgi:hypothetical protein
MRLGLTHLKVANALAYSGKASKVLQQSEWVSGFERVQILLRRKIWKKSFQRNVVLSNDKMPFPT